jgi:hypothetical protein
MIHKLNRHELNITDMTFKDLYEEFYEYKSDKVKDCTFEHICYRESTNENSELILINENFELTNVIMKA